MLLVEQMSITEYIKLIPSSSILSRQRNGLKIELNAPMVSWAFNSNDLQIKSKSVAIRNGVSHLSHFKIFSHQFPLSR